MAKHFDLNKSAKGKFNIIGSTARCQLATMELLPDEATGSAEARHPSSDQWIFVLAGEGVAVVSGETFTLSPGSMLLVEAGETHKISGSDGEALRMLTVYSPPAYEI